MEVKIDSIKQQGKAVGVYLGWLKKFYYNQKELELKHDSLILSDFIQPF